MRRATIVVLLCAVAACQHRPGARPVPVASPCIRTADLPAPVPPAGRLPGDARQAADLLGALVLQLRANERLLRALIAACTFDSDVAAPDDEWQSQSSTKRKIQPA